MMSEVSMSKPISPPPKLSIIIINYKTPELCIACLASLSSINSIAVETIVIDNASNDGSVAQIMQSITQNGWCHTRVISSENNGGFSAGNNVGISDSKGGFVLLLNSDTIVGSGAVEILITALAKDLKAGMASPRLEWPDGTPQESCFRFHRPINELIRSACTGHITKLLKRYEVPVRVSDEGSSPEWTSFACVLVRREVFERIGLLDAGFFMYFEDVDFCQRARSAGWNIINNPNARVVHLRGGSSPVKSQTAEKKRLPRYFYESRTRYYFKYFGRSGLFAANMFWHLGWLIAMVRKFASRRYQSNICEKQWRDIWTNFCNPNAPYIYPDNY